MAGHTYEVDGFHRGYPVVIGAAVVVAGIMALVNGEALGVLLLAIGGWTLFEFGFWAPHRVTLDDSGVLLQALARRIRIRHRGPGVGVVPCAGLVPRRDVCASPRAITGGACR
jgi:hypothetical protein